MHRLHRPPGFNEPAREPIQQLRVIGSLAETTKIIGGTNESLAKMTKPGPRSRPGAEIDANLNTEQPERYRAGHQRAKGNRA